MPQSDGVVAVICFILIGLPAIFAVIAVAIKWRSPMREHLHEAIIKGIAAHAAGEDVQDPLYPFKVPAQPKIDPAHVASVHALQSFPRDVMVQLVDNGEMKESNPALKAFVTKRKQAKLLAIVGTILSLVVSLSTLPLLESTTLGWMPTAFFVAFGGMLTFTIITSARAKVASRLYNISPEAIDAFKASLPVPAETSTKTENGDATQKI